MAIFLFSTSRVTAAAVSFFYDVHQMFCSFVQISCTDNPYGNIVGVDGYILVFIALVPQQQVCVFFTPHKLRAVFIYEV
jgi:hypothetical protein